MDWCALAGGSLPDLYFLLNYIKPPLGCTVVGAMYRHPALILQQLRGQHIAPLSKSKVWWIYGKMRVMPAEFNSAAY